jgi:hypothetical protein
MYDTLFGSRFYPTAPLAVVQAAAVCTAAEAAVPLPIVNLPRQCR